LVQFLAIEGQTLAAVKYFTARISGADPGAPNAVREKAEAKRRRQAIFLEALGTLDRTHIFEGHFLRKRVSCPACSQEWKVPEEKMTDARIATEMVSDAFRNQFDTAMLISGDSDLVPPVLAVRSHFPQKRIVVGFPPRRFSRDLETAAHAFFRIWPKQLKKSQFPPEVVKADGHKLVRPSTWK
jgi:hypothetical protein